ncbi:MAG: hypothetical protein AB7P99_04725 [Vicinamibacterales bacterium]
MANYGFSFAPTASNMQRGAQAPTSRPQEAVSFRSLTLPQQNTPGQIAAPSLLGAPGAMGMPSGELMKLLIQLLGGQSQRSMAAPEMPAAAQVNTAPNVSFSLKRVPVTRPTFRTDPSPGYAPSPDPVTPSLAPQLTPPVPSQPSGDLPANTPPQRIDGPSGGPLPQPTYTPPNYGGFDFGREFGGFLGF